MPIELVEINRIRTVLVYQRGFFHHTSVVHHGIEEDVVHRCLQQHLFRPEA